MRNYLAAIRSFNRSIWLFLGVWILIAIAFFGLISVLQNLYLLRLNLDMRAIGLLVGSGQLVWAIAALPAAIVSRRLGPKRALLIALALVGGSYAFMMLVEAVPGSMRLTWLLFWNIIDGLGTALFLVSGAPYLAGITSQAERTYAFAVQSAVIPLAGFVGGLFAGWLPGWIAQVTGSTLDQALPYRYALWLAPLLYFFAILVFLPAKSVSLEQTQQVETSTSARLPLATLVVFGIIGTLQATGDGVMQAFYNIYLDQRLNVSTAQIGALIGFASLLPIVVALATAPLMKRYGSGSTFGLGALGSGAMLMTMAMFPTILIAAISRFVTGITGQFSGTSRGLFSQDIVAPRWRSLSAAVSTIGIGVGWGAAALAGGYLIQAIDFSGVFFVAGVMMLASAVLTFGFVRSRKPAQAPVQAPELAESLSLD